METVVAKSLLAEPVIISALVGSFFGGIVALVGHTISRWSIIRRIEVDMRIALDKIEADREKAFSDKAWADYALRRDTYMSLARYISQLFENGGKGQKPEFFVASRQVRLIGSDEVVKALNNFTAAIKSNSGEAELLYSSLFNAMRKDIRRLRELPPEGTELDSNSFPIET